MTTESPITILPGVHTSPESAYLVDDYPYGFRLRCQIRYWLEVHPKHGTRFMSQTSNPKKGGIWNKPKASTYCRFGGAMFLDAENHVQWSGLTEYTDGKQAKAWMDTYANGVPEPARELMRRWVAAKLAYDAQPEGESMAIKAAHARIAFTAKLED